MPERPPSDLKRVAAQYHAAVQGLTENALADLQGRWQGVQATLDLKIKGLTDAIAAAQARGETVNVAWLTQAQRLEQLRAAVQGDVSAFADGAVDIVQQAVSGALDLGQAAAQAALAATVPPGVNFTFGVPPSDVAEELAAALQPGSPLAALFDQLGPQVAAFAQQALFTGVALGEGPRQIAQRLIWSTDMAARRAEVIARTETMRAWRHAQFANYQANRDVVQQWMWAADFGPRCCGACIAMDGTFHDLDSELDDHICGRCSALPITRPWSDILSDAGMSQAEIDALNLTETSGMAWAQSRESGESWLARQSTEVQNQILGLAKAEAWRQGAFPLERVVGVVHDPQWGSSIRELSLRQMGIDAQVWLQAARQADNDSRIADEEALAAAHAETSMSVAAEQKAEQVAQAKAAADEWYANIERSIAAGQAGGLTAEEAKAAANEWYTQVTSQLRPGGLSVEDVARAMEQRFGLVAEPGALEEAAVETTAERANAAIQAAEFSVAPLPAEQLAAESQRLQDALLPTEDQTRAARGADVAGEVKAQVAKALGEALADNPDFARVADVLAAHWGELLRSQGYSAEAIAAGVASAPTDAVSVASELVRSWTSGQGSLFPALQQAIADEFGLASAAEMPAEARALAGEWTAAQPGLRAFVREMYAQTQDYFAERGITEVIAYRGMGFADTLPTAYPPALFDGTPQELSVALRPGSSFSVDVATAENFSAFRAAEAEATGYEQIIAARVPVELVLSIPRTGFGALGEYEVVALGGQYQVMSLGATLDMTSESGLTSAITDEQAQALLTQDAAATTAATEVAEPAALESASTLTPEQIAAFETRELTPMEGETGIINEADMAPADRANVDTETQRIVQAIHPEDMSAGEAKQQVARSLGAALADNSEFTKIADAMADYWRRDLIEQGYSEAAADAGVAAMARDPEQIASMLIRAWADGQGTLPPALQQAIRDEFNLKAAMRLPNSALVKQARAEWAEVQPGLRAFVREMYNQTQQWFADNGITEVPLYRGMGWEKLPKWMDASLLDGQPHELTVPLRAASSFSVDTATALNFAQSPVSDIEDIRYQQVIALRVPAEAILATPQTGFGALEEYEAVVLGGRYGAIGIGVDNSVVSESSNIDEILANYHDLTYEQIADLLVTPEPKEPQS